MKSVFAEYTYDANGNTTNRKFTTAAGVKETVFAYDTLNRLVSTTEGGRQTKYAYDNAGNRLYKTSSDGLTLYLRHGQIAVALDVEVYAPTSTEGATKRGTINRYVLSGDLLAGRVQTTVPKTGASTVHKSYYHLDHLNSTKAVTNEAGAIEVSYLYRAFGEQLRKIGAGDAGYTYGGKELDEVTNLYYFNARYYDATAGRFINVDPVQDGSNWYVYCSNNPLGMKDPTGLENVKDAYDSKNTRGEISLVVTRNSASGDMNDSAKLIVGKNVLAEFSGIQSEKNYRSGTQTRAQSALPDYSKNGFPNATLPKGSDYRATLLGSDSGSSYDRPLSISSKTAQLPGYPSVGVKPEYGFLVHSWSSKDTQRTAAYSWGCQILSDGEKDRLNQNLTSLGLKAGDTIGFKIE